jgi:putative intracellular protease/amidase
MFSSSPVPATSYGGNFSGAGEIISTRIMSMEEYQAQLGQPQVVSDFVQVQPASENFRARYIESSGQVETVQAELITETIVTADGQIDQVQTLVEGGGEALQEPGPPRVVIVCTSASDLGGHPTGAWSEEITGPYYVFKEAGCEVYIASTQGGPVPIDQGSLSENFFTENDRRFQEEGGLQLLDNAFAISEVAADQIDCVFLAGGHGTCMDFEENLAQYVTDAAAFGRPIGAVCHGVIGLLGAINQDGTPLIAGRPVTGFSNAEEEAVGLADKVPFLLQDRMCELGASYTCGEPWTEYATSDGKIITGQNPQSSVLTAKLCVEAMSYAAEAAMQQ